MSIFGTGYEIQKLSNHNLLYFGSFSNFDVMPNGWPELSRKWRISGNSFKTLANAKSVSIKVTEYLQNWSHDSEIVSPFILKVLHRLA